MNLNQKSRELLDAVYADLASPDSKRVANSALSRLFEGLRELRHAASSEEWPDLRACIQAHPLREILHEDPMTRRSFEKPRGYAGDAVLLDYIYGEPSVDAEPPSDLAHMVQRYAIGRPAAAAVRHRREWLGFQIDRSGDRALRAGKTGARVLSVACGHLREGHNSVALNAGLIREFVAVDADPESLAEVDRSGWPAVQSVKMSVARLLAGAGRLGTFDLIYSAGLYDYLDDALAQRLTAKLFHLLEPGGRLLLTNFLPQVADAGYMETFMGWDLLYRDLEGVRALAADIDPGLVAALDVREDAFQAVGTLEIQRAT